MKTNRLFNTIISIGMLTAANGSQAQDRATPITTNDGKSHSTRVDVPKGDPRDPMTEDEIAVKFTALGGDVIGKDQCKKLQRFIMSMETADKLDGLFELTTAR